MTGRLAALKLPHLRLIHAIAETRQLSLAAARLGVTQPAASRRLAEVEAMTGEPLFERTPKGMAPTPLGAVMIRHAATLVGDLDAVAQEVDAFQAGLVGSVRVGAVTGAAVGYVVPAIRRLKAEAPRADVRLDVAPSVELMDGLMRGDHDLLLSRVPPGADARLLEVMRGRVEEVRFLTRAGHPMLDRRGVALADLAGCAWVIQSPGNPIRHAVEQAFSGHGLPAPVDVLNTSSLLAMLEYLRSTDAVAAITREVEGLLTATSATGWGVLDVREDIILSPYHLIRVSGRRLSPLAARLLDLLLEELSPRAR